jgi:hypothetical protein
MYLSLLLFSINLNLNSILLDVLGLYSTNDSEETVIKYNGVFASLYPTCALINSLIDVEVVLRTS